MKFSNKLSNIVIFIVVIILSYWIFKDIHYTDDFDVYERFYSSTVDRSGDLGFGLLEQVSNKYRLNFYEFYNLVVFIEVVLFATMFAVYNVNVFLSTSLTYAILYVQIANQIRYFIAMPLFLIGLNILFAKKKIIPALLILFASYSFHNGIITLFLFIPLYYYINKRQYDFKKMVRLYCILGIVGLLNFSLLFSRFVASTGRFENYSNSATFLGTLYMILLPISCLSIIYFANRKFDFNSCNPTLKLAVALSFFTVLWIIISLSGVQIINARYVNALLPIWIISILIATKDNKYRFWYIFAFLCFAFVFKYLIADVMFRISDLDKIKLIWASKYLI